MSKNLILIIWGIFFSFPLLSQSIKYNGFSNEQNCTTIDAIGFRLSIVGHYKLINTKDSSFRLSGHFNLINPDSGDVYYSSFISKTNSNVNVSVSEGKCTFSFLYYLYDYKEKEYDSIYNYVDLTIDLDSNGKVSTHVTGAYHHLKLSKKELSTLSKSLDDNYFIQNVNSMKFIHSLFEASISQIDNATYYFVNFYKIAKENNLTNKLGPEMGYYYDLLQIYYGIMEEFPVIKVKNYTSCSFLKD